MSGLAPQGAKVALYREVMRHGLEIEMTTEQKFLSDVAEHQMTVIRDDGLHRHIRFKRPGTMCMHFDLITWPGYLCYTGDMGTYVFRRLDDMFEFFRTDRMGRRSGHALAINRSYWAEKIEAADRCDGVKKFSEERFNRAVLEHLISWLRDHRDDTTRDERRDLWDAVMFEVLGADGDSGGYRKQVAAHDFSHKVNDLVGEFYFRDFWERTVDDWTYRYVWCCYALAWGIQRYDDSKTTAQAA